MQHVPVRSRSGLGRLLNSCLSAAHRSRFPIRASAVCSARFNSGGAKGKLYVCGWSQSGALGLGDAVSKAQVPSHVPTESDVVSVACSKKFTLFATETGSVFAMGENSNGELGSTAAGKTQTTPLQVEGLNGVKIVQVSAGKYGGASGTRL